MTTKDGMSFQSTRPEDGWGRARREPRWRALETSGHLEHVETKQTIRLTPFGWVSCQRPKTL